MQKIPRKVVGFQSQRRPTKQTPTPRQLFRPKGKRSRSSFPISLQAMQRCSHHCHKARLCEGYRPVCINIRSPITVMLTIPVPQGHESVFISYSLWKHSISAAINIVNTSFAGVVHGLAVFPIGFCICIFFLVLKPICPFRYSNSVP